MNRQPADLVEEPEIELGELRGSVGFMLRIAQLQSFDLFFAQLSKDGLKPGEFTMLWIVGLNPGLRQGAVARCLRIKPAHMTKLVQRMAAAGFVRREVPGDDRRSVRLSLTPAGKAFVALRRRAFVELHRLERSNLSDAETAQLLDLLGKLTGIDASPDTGTDTGLETGTEGDMR